jgi:hypothetical protein
MTSIVVGAGLARRPLNGGGPWARLQWIYGLRRLGFDVYLIDQLGPESFVDETGAVTSFENSLNLAHFRRIVETAGLAGSAALLYGEGEAIEGATQSDLFARAEAADLLINIGGKLGWEPLLRRFRHKAYVDIDPGTTQFSGASQAGGAPLGGYDAYFTVGANIGTPGCLIPMDDLPWRPIRPPVALDHWPLSNDGDPSLLTTVATWRGRTPGSREHGSRTFGLKADEFRRFAELPDRVEQRFEIALNLHAPQPLLPDGPYPPPLDPLVQSDVELLRRHGWRLVDPRVAAPDPDAFRSYIHHSGGEFSAAQGIFVETNSGWFSDRSACYLASGKPVLVQDTGFGRTLPVGDGLVSFRTLAEAVEGARRIARDYSAHCVAARAIAEEYFDSDTVLRRLLDEADVAA